MSRPEFDRIFARTAYSRTEDPDILIPGKVDSGYYEGERPVVEHFNWLFNLITKQTEYLDRSGVSPWDATKLYYPGDTVMYDGMLWESQFNQSNTEPGSNHVVWNEVNYNPHRIYNVESYGADPTSSAGLNQYAIQRAINLASSDGGTVFIPKGIYQCGPLELKSNITFEMARGAFLFYSETSAIVNSDSIIIEDPNYPVSHSHFEYRAFVRTAQNSSNITLKNINMSMVNYDTATLEYGACPLAIVGSSKVAIENSSLSSSQNNTNAEFDELLDGLGVNLLMLDSSMIYIDNISLLGGDHSTLSIRAGCEDIYIYNSNFNSELGKFYNLSISHLNPARFAPVRQYGEAPSASHPAPKNIKIHNCNFRLMQGKTSCIYAHSVENLNISDCNFKLDGGAYGYAPGSSYMKKFIHLDSYSRDQSGNPISQSFLWSNETTIHNCVFDDSLRSYTGDPIRHIQADTNGVKISNCAFRSKTLSIDASYNSTFGERAIIYSDTDLVDSGSNPFEFLDVLNCHFHMQTDGPGGSLTQTEVIGLFHDKVRFNENTIDGDTQLGLCIAMFGNDISICGNSVDAGSIYYNCLISNSSERVIITNNRRGENITAGSTFATSGTVTDSTKRILVSNNI